jgi:predicted GIY-YIG superfamily endonuclease
MQGGWVSIMTNRRNGTLYVGATANLARRVWEHRNNVADSVTKNMAYTGSSTQKCMTTFLRRNGEKATSSTGRALGRSS